MCKGTKPREKQGKTENCYGRPCYSFHSYAQEFPAPLEAGHRYSSYTSAPSRLWHFTLGLKQPSPVLRPNSAVLLGGGKSLQWRRWCSSSWADAKAHFQACSPVPSHVSVWEQYTWLHTTCGDHQDHWETNPNSGAEQNVTPSWLFCLN